MSKKKSKENIKVISFAVGFFAFIVFHIIWLNSPFAEILFQLWSGTESVWWSERLIAGTLGYFGLAIISMPLYPVPFIVYFIGKWTDKGLNRLRTTHNYR